MAKRKTRTAPKEKPPKDPEKKELELLLVAKAKSAHTCKGQIHTCRKEIETIKAFLPNIKKKGYPEETLKYMTGEIDGFLKYVNQAAKDYAKEVIAPEPPATAVGIKATKKATEPLDAWAKSLEDKFETFKNGIFLDVRKLGAYSTG